MNYDASTEVLTIFFVTGRVYAYKGVPPEIYERMKGAFSKGIFFNRHIKDRYAFERIR